MKILQVGKFYPIRGGVEKVMWDLTRGLAERGIDCDMLCAILDGNGPDWEDRDRQAESPEGVRLAMRFGEHGRVLCVRALRKVAATMISPAMVRYLRRHASEYDIVHVHHPDPMAALALRLSGYRGRVILHWHSDILKQKGLLRLYRPLQNWLIRRADLIVGTTPVYVSESPWLSKVQPKVGYIPIGVEPMHPDPVKVAKFRGEHEGARIIYSLGRLVGYKGYEYLVRAAALLPEEYHVVIGGMGPLQNDLEELARDLGVQNRVTFLGWVSAQDSDSWYGACDVFCLSSIWKTEAFAIVQIEAMSCARPVVATRIPGSGVSWVNADGLSGLNVPVEDPRAMADAILEVCGERHEAFKAGALERYNTTFTFDAMIDKCIETYERVLSQ